MTGTGLRSGPAQNRCWWPSAFQLITSALPSFMAILHSVCCLLSLLVQLFFNYHSLVPSFHFLPMLVLCLTHTDPPLFSFLLQTTRSFVFLSVSDWARLLTAASRTFNCAELKEPKTNLRIPTVSIFGSPQLLAPRCLKCQLATKQRCRPTSCVRDNFIKHKLMSSFCEVSTNSPQ